MASVTFDHVTKAFADDAVAVNDLDLLIKDGEFLVLVGPSGCGKSTALRILAGLEETGRADRDRRARREPRAAEGPRHRDGVPVLRALSAHDGVRQPRVRPQAAQDAEGTRSSAASRRRARCSASNATSTASRKALSGGQRQRVALGRAIVREPAVFLLDEPLSNLDAKLRVQMRAEMLRLHQRLGTTMIYVTHDQVEAMTMGDRIAVMRTACCSRSARRRSSTSAR